MTLEIIGGITLLFLLAMVPFVVEWKRGSISFHEPPEEKMQVLFEHSEDNGEEDVGAEQEWKYYP